MGSKVLLHSDSLITGGVFRKPRGVSSMVAENCRGEQTRQGRQGRPGKFSVMGVARSAKSIRLMVENFTHSNRQWGMSCFLFWGRIW